MPDIGQISCFITLSLEFGMNILCLDSYLSGLWFLFHQRAHLYHCSYRRIILKLEFHYLIWIFFTMNKSNHKKVSYRAKDQFTVRFGFQYNEEAINYRTQIPPLPQKPKHKPDEKIRDKRVGEVEAKILKLKETRQKKKEQIKKMNSYYDDQIQQLKGHVALGRKCIHVLEFDIDIVNEEIGRKSGLIKRWQNKIQDFISQIKQLRFKNRPAKKFNKNYEEMTNYELDQERKRIEHVMTTKSLSKKEQAELNNKLNKITRAKLESNRPVAEQQNSSENSQRIKDLEEQIARIKEKMNKVKSQRFALFHERQELQDKKEDIKDDIANFFQKLNQLADIVDSNNQTLALREESKTIKENIYKLREDIGKINSEFEERIKEYQIEQEKIKWIGWALKVQERKRQQWEEQKAERKKQKNKEKVNQAKNKEGSKVEGSKKDAKQGQKEEKPIERKKFNKNQRQIDTCSYLVDYCKRLYPSDKDLEKNEQKKDVNIKAQIKKGQWAKEKGIQVIESKKTKKDDEDQPSKVKYNRKKQQPREEEVVPSNRFSHDYFVAQSFDSVKVIPPNNVEELDKTLKYLEDKLEYYLLHPDENIENKFAKDKQYLDKTAAPQKESYKSKYTKSKPSKSVINTEEFPSL